MKKYLLYIGVVISFLVMISCGKDSTYPSTPYLKYESISPKELNTSQKVTITCTFRDKEGDIQGKGGLWYRVINLTTDSNTTNFDDYQHPVPNFPQKSNVGGEIIVKLSPTTDFTVGTSLGGGSDSVYFELFLKDQAGHYSDTIRTDTILIHG